jgi:N-acetylmuramidase/Putative peptidoglycan binding domain
MAFWHLRQAGRPCQWESIMVEFSGAGTALSSDGLGEASHTAGVGLPEIWSVLSVETSGCGFLPDRRPKLLFERHIFHRLTDGRFDAEDPDVSQPTPGGYGPGGTNQYERLAAAIQLDRGAALQSASWGIGQIMGMNFASAGFAGVEEMIDQMVGSEDRQLLAVAKFMIANGMGEPLRNHDWAGFARRYNGSNYAANDYDGKLQHFYQRYADGDLPSLQVRAAQVYLRYLGSPNLAVDGVMGPSTAAAVRQFQQSRNLPQTGLIDDALIAQLLAALQ